MIQDIEPYKLKNEFYVKEPNESDYLIFIKNRTILYKRVDRTVELPTYKMLIDGNYEIHTTYLFSIENMEDNADKKSFYLVWDKNDILAENLIKLGYEFCNLRILLDSEPRWICFAAVTAHHLGSWYQINRYCGGCGHKLIPSTKERMLYCKECNNRVYPKIAPVIIAGIIDGDRILMTKYAGKEHTSKFSLVAGFTEFGETIEETVQREVKEETGLNVKNMKYYKSQPWGLSESLLFGFFCELDGSAKITLEEDELACAKWATQVEVPIDPNRNSLTYEMMEQFKEKGRGVLL